MTSRLDRLFILLESGSSAATRRAAAKQIGEVQKLYPHKLHALLNRLIGYLHNPSWETRIAAAQTVEAILKNIPPWQPELHAAAGGIIKREIVKKESPKPDASGEDDSCQSSGSHVSSSTTSIAGDAANTQNGNRLYSFADFDLEQILQKGARLFGSEGMEFDEQDDQLSNILSNIDNTKRLSRQRSLLNKKLGLTQASKLGVNLTDMITDEDMMRSSNNSKVNEEKLPVECILNNKANKNAANGNDDNSTGHQQQNLSSREINRAKRKARQNAVASISGAITTNAASAAGISNANNSNLLSHRNSTVSMNGDEPEKKKHKSNNKKSQEVFYNLNDPVPDVTGTWVDAVSWPLENFCAHLYKDLFNAKWEVRHGAATALRELINNCADNAGKSIYMTREEMCESHNRWLEDAALRLLCVLSLDRFGDFITDQVIAPVRETCAQVLGTLVKEIDADKVLIIVSLLLKLVKNKTEWEVRHGGLLGLKYVFVVREELLQKFLPETINDILIGLFDVVDDVGAVAASTLIPVASWLPKLLTPTQVSTIVKMLWDLLLDQDELTSACNSFMGLLAAILSLPNAANWIQMESMSTLVPRLWPFLSHSTSSVRKSTLQTLDTLTCNNQKDLPTTATISAENAHALAVKTNNLSLFNFDADKLKLNFGVIDWHWELLQEALRHIYQRILVEPQADIQAMACTVWSNLIKNAELGALLQAACPYVSSWICLAMQPSRLAFDSTLLIHTKPNLITEGAHIMRRRKQRFGDEWNTPKITLKLFLGGSEATPIEVREANYVRARIMASRVLGALSHYLVQLAPGVAYLTESPTDIYTKVLISHLNARSAVQHIVCGLLIAFWTLNDESIRPELKTLQDKLCSCIEEYFYYDEITFSMTRLVEDTKDFIAALKQNKIISDDFNGIEILRLDQIETIANIRLADLQTHTLKPKMLQMLLDRRKALYNTYQQTLAEQMAYHVSAQAALACAICALNCLPNKLNPVIKPLMESIKREDCTLLQEISAEFLVHLMDQVCDRNPSPNSKILNNLCVLLRSNPEYTPEINRIERTLSETQPPVTASINCVYYGILTLSLQQNIVNINRQSTSSTTPVTRGPGRPSLNETSTVAAAVAAAVATADNVSNEDQELETKRCRIQRLGAECAITKLCRAFGARLIEKVPIFYELMFGKIIKFVSLKKTITELAHELPILIEVNELLMSLQLIETAAPHLDTTLHEQLFELLPHLGVIVTHPLKALRHMAARCVATLASIDACRTMDYVVKDLIGLLQKIEQIIERQGAIETIERVVDKLQIKIVPYIVLLVVPLLGCMSDPDESVRLLATHCFATLIQLMPLDAAKSTVRCKQEIKSAELQARKTRDREFLDYLFAPKTIPDFKVPVPIAAELRSYQQAGINWLWFLNKYNLHGILCDDMGLGKTLQTICILAGDHYQCRLNKESLPSLVICPPTLTGHWVYEIEKFLQKSEILHPLHYVGLPISREKLRCHIGKTCNLVVASYDTIRKDIDYFKTVHWNYCVLDEGHIIKNGKTKSSQAIKQLRAKHRLILSGTPIQNNVLELWSLFDFLMPGFLGTERQFIVRYSRPILASRDPKSSTKEQEAGVLAMEALHRQVLPFLLRRVKEDVLTDLPPKITQDLLCELSPLQQRLYEDFSNKHLKDCLDKLGDNENLNNNKAHIFQALRYLQNVCNHPKLVLGNAAQVSKVAADIKSKNIILDDIEHSAKLPALKQLLLDCGIGVQTESVSQHRALIFCQLKAMLDIVETDLLRKHLPTVTYLRLDGSVAASVRQDIVNQFNSDPSIDVLLLTTLVGGLGLNLTGADTVIFVEHDWNPMKDLQAMDRAHRIGQKRVVNVYRLITRNSLEEKIMGLQKFKILTANTVVSAENASLQTMGTSEIFDLFGSKNGNKNADVNAAATSANVAGINSMIENLPELWSEHQYEEEYDLSNFVQTLKK